MQTEQTNLKRKQFLISESQIEKLERLAKGEGTSAAEMVRQAIDAYNPNDETNTYEASELMDLVHKQLKEAIKSTRKAAKAVSATLDRLSTGRPK